MGIFQSSHLLDFLRFTVLQLAPELVLGSRVYSSPVDIWACGVILYEMLTLTPLLPGERREAFEMRASRDTHALCQPRAYSQGLLTYGTRLQSS